MRRRAWQGDGRLPSVAMAALRAEIVRFLDDTRGRRNWAHKGLQVAIAHLGVDEARWTPPAGHSVWEQINHIAYWKRYIVARVQGRRTPARQAWPPGGRTAAELRRAVGNLEALHRDLHTAVLAVDQDRLTAGPRYSVAQLLLGEAAHESYHIGQIFLTRRQYRRQRSGR